MNIQAELEAARRELDAAQAPPREEAPGVIAKALDVLSRALGLSESLVKAERRREACAHPAGETCEHCRKSAPAAAEEDAEKEEEEEARRAPEPPAVKSQLAERAYYQALADGAPELAKAVELVPALERAVDAYGASLGNYAHLAAQVQELEALTRALAEGQLALLKALAPMARQLDVIARQPVAPTHPGVVTVAVEQQGLERGGPPPDLKERIVKALESGKLAAEYAYLLAMLDTRGPEQVWRLLPKGVEL